MPQMINVEQNIFADVFVKTDNILQDMCGIIEQSRDTAYKAVNTVLVKRNWLIGYRIAEEELRGVNRADYGTGIISTKIFHVVILVTLCSIIAGK